MSSVPRSYQDRLETVSQTGAGVVVHDGVLESARARTRGTVPYLSPYTLGETTGLSRDGMRKTSTPAMMRWAKGSSKPS